MDTGDAGIQDFGTKLSSGIQEWCQSANVSPHQISPFPTSHTPNPPPPVPFRCPFPAPAHTHTHRHALTHKVVSPMDAAVTGSHTLHPQEHAAPRPPPRHRPPPQSTPPSNNYPPPQHAQHPLRAQVWGWTTRCAPRPNPCPCSSRVIEGVLACRVCTGQPFGLFPIPTPVGPLRRLRLCSQSAHFWAPKKAGVTNQMRRQMTHAGVLLFRRPPQGV